MIAIESFKKFRKIDLFIIAILSLIWFSIILLSNKLNPQTSYILSVLTGTILLALNVHLVRKAGSATLFFLLGGLFTYNLNDLGIIGIKKVLLLILTGFVFEIIFIILKLEIKQIPLDVVLGTAFSAASIPWITGFFLSYELTLTMIRSVINLSLLSFFLGIAGAIIAFLIWYNLKLTKWVLKFEYSQI